MQEQRLERRGDFNNYESVAKSGDQSDTPHLDSDSSVDNLISAAANSQKSQRYRTKSLVPTLSGIHDQFEIG